MPLTGKTTNNQLPMPIALPELALSVRQPFAHQIIHAYKTLEFRSSATRIRGPVWVYASKTPAHPDCIGVLTLGMLIGAVSITDCVAIAGGEFAYVLSAPRASEVPIWRSEWKPQPRFWRPYMPNGQEFWDDCVPSRKRRESSLSHPPLGELL